MNVQKFVPRSRDRIFHDEPTRSTPFVPKLMFWCVLYRLGIFATIWLPYETRGKTFRTSAKVCATSRVESFRNERSRSTPLDPKLMFWCVLYHFGAFGTIWLPISEQSEVTSEFFTTKAPDPPHWTLNSCFVVFPTIWVHL